MPTAAMMESMSFPWGVLGIDSDIAINPALTKQGCYKHFNKPVYNNPVKNELLVGFRCGTLAFLTAVS